MIGSKSAPLLRSRSVSGADVPYFGAPLAFRMLVPDGGARIMPTRFDDWLGRAAA